MSTQCAGRERRDQARIIPAGFQPVLPNSALWTSGPGLTIDGWSAASIEIESKHFRNFQGTLSLLQCLISIFTVLYQKNIDLQEVGNKAHGLSLEIV